MTLILEDMDKIVASYLFAPSKYPETNPGTNPETNPKKTTSRNNRFFCNINYRLGSELLKKIMITFGRSDYDLFIKICRDYYFKELFASKRFPKTPKEILNKNLLVEDMYTFLQCLTYKNNIKFYPCYTKFLKLKSEGDQNISFEKMKARDRLIIYFLSLYHGYIWVCTNTEMFEEFGYEYWDLYSDGNGPYKYSFLKRKRIHNLKYYDLVKKADTLNDSLFNCKKGVYKVGITKELKDITCIKIID